MCELSIDIIVFEILTRVPVKVVGRSRSVCKEWNVLLSGQDFIQKHSSRLPYSSSQKALIITHQNCSIYPIDIETHDFGTNTNLIILFNHRSYDNLFIDLSILSHLNGLLCVCSNYTSELFLWNPVTTAFKRLSFPFTNDFYQGIFDTVGLYTDTHGDFKVMYIRRRDKVLSVNVYSRSDESWRNIPLSLPSQYLTSRFYFSVGTLCGDALYFVISDTMIGGSHFMISFDIISEQFYVMNLPPIRNFGLSQVCVVNAQGKLVMFASTGYHEIQINMCILEEGTWHLVHSFPEISLDLWCSITHYVTNGNKWFVMAGSQKIFELDTGLTRCDRFYSSTHWTCSTGALFTETLVSPSV